MTKIACLIPARFQSQRLPGKPLKEIRGKTLIERVYGRAIKADSVGDVYILTDHEDIYNHAAIFTDKVIMTADTHPNGTSRICEVLDSIEADVIINLQGDEPFIDPARIDLLSELMKKDEVSIGTCYHVVQSAQDLFDYNKVKLVKSVDSKILYFSRAAIPAHRDLAYAKWYEAAIYYQHVGIYGFKKEALEKYTSLKASSLEQLESLEQLRWLENNYSIYGVEVEVDNSFGIDTEEDLIRARALLDRSEVEE